MNYLIVGLGNFEDKYQNTRHNLGFEVIDKFARKVVDKDETSELSWQNNSKLKSQILKVDSTLTPKHSTLILAKPQTFMNNSGVAVSALAHFYKIPPEQIIIIHDELDLNLGQIKVRLGGGAAGHHGVESVITILGTPEFLRVRLGIGSHQTLLGEHKKSSFSAEHYVLDLFLPNESAQVKTMIKKSLHALELLISQGITVAQNQYN